MLGGKIGKSFKNLNTKMLERKPTNPRAWLVLIVQYSEIIDIFSGLPYLLSFNSKK
jgi:hypothetical protein